MRSSSAAPRIGIFGRPWISGASGWALTGFLAMAAVVAGGCSSKDVLVIEDSAHFRQVLGDATRSMP